MENLNEVLAKKESLRAHFGALPLLELRAEMSFLSEPAVKRVRIRLNLTQQKMSWEVGCTEGTIKRLERESRLPAQGAMFEAFRRLADRAGVDIWTSPNKQRRLSGGCCIEELMLACEERARRERIARRMVEEAFGGASMA